MHSSISGTEGHLPVLKKECILLLTAFPLVLSLPRYLPGPWRLLHLQLSQKTPNKGNENGNTALCKQSQAALACLHGQYLCVKQLKSKFLFQPLAEDINLTN